MTLAIAPADEACVALVDRINSGTDYVLDVDATYTRRQTDLIEGFNGLCVDVVAGEESQPAETLDDSDPSSHNIQVIIRRKFTSDDRDVIVPQMALLCRQLFERLNNWDSDDRRVRVWDCDADDKENPDKGLLDANLFRSSINLRVEVAR